MDQHLAILKLCEPLQLGSYINFLIEQIEHYASENPVKALKRALSLARIVMLPEWCDTLIQQLQDPRAALTSARSSVSPLADNEYVFGSCILSGANATSIARLA
jgi:hypothetical protein